MVKGVAVVEPNLTAVAAVKFRPIIVMLSPGNALVGEKPVIFGVTLKLTVEQIVPALFVTQIGQEVAPAGTMTLIEFNEVGVMGVTSILQKLTFVTLERFVP